jgi:hypothetical protein
MPTESKARRLGFEAAAAAICEAADKMSRRDWRLFCGAPVRSDLGAR